MDSFSWKRIFKVTGVITAIGIAAGGLYLAVVSRPVKIAWASLIYNRKELFVDCQDLPFYPQVEKAFSEHADIATQVISTPGVTGFKAERVNCPSAEGKMYFIKGDALLSYGSRSARDKAQNILGKDFFGIPYRGESR